ncbi:MAG: hypothetical protein R2705_22595 [Ilumatobacteraceae bacterium]
MIPGLRAYGRQLLGRTAIIGSAADTVTVAVEAAILAIQIADGAVEHVRSGSSCENMVGRPIRSRISMNGSGSSTRR